MQIKSKQVLVAIAAKHHGYYEEAVKALDNKEPISDEEIAKYSRLCQNALTVFDDDWPNAWRHDPMHPFVVFSKEWARSLLFDAHSSSFNTSLFDEAPDNAVLILDKLITPSTDAMGSELIKRGYTVVRPDFLNGWIVLQGAKGYQLFSEFIDGCYNRYDEAHIRRVAHAAAGLCNRVFVGYGTPKSAVSCAVDSIRYRDGKVCAAPAELDSKDSINNTLLQEGADIALSWKDIVAI